MTDWPHCVGVAPEHPHVLDGEGAGGAVETGEPGGRFFRAGQVPAGHSRRERNRFILKPPPPERLCTADACYRKDRRTV